MSADPQQADGPETEDAGTMLGIIATQAEQVASELQAGPSLPSGACTEVNRQATRLLRAALKCELSTRKDTR